MINKADQPLIKSNPHLRNPKERHAQFITGVLTSTSIEGVAISPSQLKKRTKAAKRK